MAEVRQRICVVQSVLAGRIMTGGEVFDTELIFVQFRKTLELIAFGSLCANKAAYSAAYKKLRCTLEGKGHAESAGEDKSGFYPVPLDPPQEIAPGRKHFPRPVDSFMTQDDRRAL